MNITPEVDAQLAEVFATEDGPIVPCGCGPEIHSRSAKDIAYCNSLMRTKPGKDYVPQSVLTGPKSKQRLVIRFDPATQNIYREGTKNRTDGNRLRGAVVTHMVINEGARTPTGGLFTSIRFTVNYNGMKWVGQTKKGTDIVRLRPFPGMK